jgi:hypothetical protein
MPGIDDDGAGRLIARIGHRLPAQLRWQLLRCALIILGLGRVLGLRRVLGQWLVEPECRGERKRLRKGGADGDRDNRKRGESAPKTGTNC